MNESTNDTTTYPLTNTRSDMRPDPQPFTTHYRIAIDIDALTDDDATALMRDMHRAALAAMIDDATHIYANDISDDDTDYFFATADAAAHLTALLCDLDFDPADALRRALTTTDLPDALITCTFDTALQIDFDYDRD